MIKKQKKSRVSDLNIETQKSDENIVITKEENIVEYFLNKELPLRKAKTKMRDDDFILPKLSEYSNLLTINYNIQQLKKISKEYTIRASGNKDELKKRIYNHMYYSYFSNYIQKFVRKIFVKNYIALHGPGFYNRSRCTNDCDFATLDELKSIPYTQFFSFEDEDKFIYVFDILSIYNLYIKNLYNFFFIYIIVVIFFVFIFVKIIFFVFVSAIKTMLPPKRLVPKFICIMIKANIF